MPANICTLAANAYESERNARLVYKLMGLGMAGAVLHVGAHPDDEDVGLLAYLSCRFGTRAVYWSATRGEGGQNRIGPYSEEALGIYRTWESLNARNVDGGECLFGPFYDFGYTKNADKPLAKWGEENLVREIVRAIRMVQPHVVVARWKGTPEDFHGHHQAVGLATVKAFELAGREDLFPELDALGLPPWRPVKLYHSLNNTGGDLTAGGAINLRGCLNPEFEKDGILRINTGAFDPVAGITYQARAWLAYNHHKTQAMGLAPAPGDFFYYFSLFKSLAPVEDREESIYDGFDPTLAGLADYPGNGSENLRSSLGAIAEKCSEALRQYRVDDPLQAGRSLLEAIGMLRELRDGLEEYGLGKSAAKALKRYLSWKTARAEVLAAACMGFELEAVTGRARVIPGQRCRVSTWLRSYRDVPLDGSSFSLEMPGDWEAREQSDEDGGGLPAGLGSYVAGAADYDVSVPETADLSHPYWLERGRDTYAYLWPDADYCGSPFGPPGLTVRCDLRVNGVSLALRRPVICRQAFPGGFRELPLSVIPPISLHPKNSCEFLPVSAEEQVLQLQVVIRNNSEAPVSGHLDLMVPGGWRTSPGRVELSLANRGDMESVSYRVSVPARADEGRYVLRYRVECGGRGYAVVMDTVRMAAPGLPFAADETNHVQEDFIIKPAEVEVHLVAARFTPGLRYGYVQGAREGLTEVLKPFGVNFHILTDEDIGYGDLGKYDVIVIGPNAYLMSSDLRKFASRFLEYAGQGGTLVVQYQGYRYETPGLAPYPFKFTQPHDRVTYEDAPVEILDAEHPIFRIPNHIGPEDFDGWVRDRGLYFFGAWDKRYTPLLASSDPDEDPQRGGLVECQYGRGSFVYTGYSFFRQLPAGVPGSFRLFANILALPEARILERIAFLRRYSLFSVLSEEQLDAVARLMSERWEEGGTFLCRQGDEGNELYIVYRGDVEVLVETAYEQKLVYVAGKGDCIGELAVLGNVTRIASLRTRGEVQLLVISGPVFMSLLRDHSDMSIRIIRFLVDRYLSTKS